MFSVQKGLVNKDGSVLIVAAKNARGCARMQSEGTAPVWAKLRASPEMDSIEIQVRAVSLHRRRHYRSPWPMRLHLNLPRGLQL